jgi:hypothetical protein
VLRVLGNDAFEERTRLGGPFCPQQALAEMGSGVDVRGVTFK